MLIKLGQNFLFMDGVDGTHLEIGGRFLDITVIASLGLWLYILISKVVNFTLIYIISTLILVL